MPGTKHQGTFTKLATANIEPYTRVVLDGAGGVAVADNLTIDIGTLAGRALNGQPVAVLPRNVGGVIFMIAAGAISEGDEVFAAAAGRIAGSGTISIGHAEEAAAAAGDVIGVVRD